MPATGGHVRTRPRVIVRAAPPASEKAYKAMEY